MRGSEDYRARAASVLICFFDDLPLNNDHRDDRHQSIGQEHGRVAKVFCDKSKYQGTDSGAEIVEKVHDTADRGLITCRCKLQGKGGEKHPIDNGNSSVDQA